MQRVKKIHLISLGCPRNLVDSEVMLGILLENGYEVTLDLKKADLILINTCAFLKASREESIFSVKEALKLRKRKAKVVLAGCMVQAFSREILQLCPRVDFLLGAGEVDNVLQAAKSATKRSLITTRKSFLEGVNTPRKLSTPSHYAYLKIAEGCSKRCSYCLIPKIKGILKSKKIEQVKREFQLLLSRGVKEIILIAQDLGDFGKDLGFSQSKGLVVLLKELLKEKGDYWVRLLYLYPDGISPELIHLMKEDERLLPYFDIPLQHIHPQILRAMNRKISKEKILSLITDLRNQIPQVIIRSSFIVGFPGETDEHFEELLHFIKNYRLDHVGVFKYSQEAGTLAAEKKNQIPEKVKEKRYQILMETQQKVVEKKMNRLVGETAEAFVEGYDSEVPLLMRARYWGQCPEVDGAILIVDGRKVRAFGEKHSVLISGVAGYDLIGKVVAGSQSRIS